MSEPSWRPLVQEGAETEEDGPRFQGVELTPKWQQVKDNQKYKNQILVFETYQHNYTQYVVAFIILLNFFVQIWKRQFDAACGWEAPIETKHHHAMHATNATNVASSVADMYQCHNEEVWHIFSWFFNIVFLVELLWNLAGSCWTPFIQDSWNHFDMLVVGLGVLDMSGVDLGKLKLLRMLRAFRIFRLFGRVPALKKVLGSLVNAFFGVANAFLIVIIVMCICAVLAVDMFGNTMCQDDDPITATLDYGFHGGECWGKGYYGDFLTSLYTMFQILTGESWSEGCVWPLLDYYHARGDGLARVGIMTFFVGFIIVGNFVLLNVVVAVLLDGMSQVEDVKEVSKAGELTPEGAELMKRIVEIERAHTQNISELRVAIQDAFEKKILRRTTSGTS